MRKLRTVLFWISFFAAFAAVSVTSEEDNGYLTVTGPCNLEFPRDHAAHPGYRTEWWYYTGNVVSDDNQSFGYQLTIFRRQISPSDARRRWPKPASRWRTQQLYLGHFALSDISGKVHYFDEAIARGALGLAGVRGAQDRPNVYLKKWSIEIGSSFHRIQAATPKFAIDLVLDPEKQPVLHGDGGYSLKGNSSERASCYYSFTRLQTTGTVNLNGQKISVSGLSWMDHEFSTASLQSDILGWDWFSLQLSDGSELMAFLLRQEDGRLNQASSGTLVFPDGSQQHLRIQDFSIAPVSTWPSPHSGAVYPERWSIRIPSKDIILTVNSNLADQEMRTEGSTGVTYWEGSVSVNGQSAGRAVRGQGYAELTGYAKKFEQEL